MPIGLTSLTEFFHDLFAQHGGRDVRNFCPFVQAIAYPPKDHSAHSLKQYAVRIVCQKVLWSLFHKKQIKFLLKSEAKNRTLSKIGH